MISPIYSLYVLCVAFIRIYKWIEYQLWKPFTPIIRRIAKSVGRKLGVVVHCPGDLKRSKEDLHKIISKLPKKYGKNIIHLKVHNELLFSRALSTGSLGCCDSYLDGMWDVDGDKEQLTQFIKRILDNRCFDMYYNIWNSSLEWLELYAFNLQTRQRAFQVGVEHYDLGNKLYEKMLDPWLQYTCAYWPNANDLATAQINKMELIAKKLNLKPGMRVLDIGCGWGTLCKYLAEKYKVECVGITVGEEGAKYGNKICKGLPVEIRVQDYRDVDEKFDRILSIGMFEHVGFHNYREYFKVARKCLKNDGLFLLQTIGRNHNHKFPGRSEPFTHKHIFPNGSLPEPADICEKTNKIFVIEDWHNFGQDYAKTLYCWRENFMKEWPSIKGDYDERFYKLWVLYLSMARACFLSRRLQLWQIVFSKEGLQSDYRALR